MPPRTLQQSELLSVSTCYPHANVTHKPTQALVPKVHETFYLPVPQVKHVLRTWLGREGLLSSNTTTALTRSKGSTRASTINTLSTPPVVPSVPLFALGASSGGAFAMFLAMHQDVHFSGVCSIVMAVPQALLFKHVHSHKVNGTCLSDQSYVLWQLEPTANWNDTSQGGLSTISELLCELWVVL